MFTATRTTTMKAITHDSYGGPEQLRLVQRAAPQPADDEVLLKVAAAGLDRGTWHLMHGLPYIIRPAFGLRAPRQPIPGLDVAGTVVAVGADVTNLAVGDSVFGFAKGSFAEYAVADPNKLAPMPSGLEPAAAAALGVSGLTALGAVYDKAHVKAGQRVLITGASGGVGSYAVQLAADLGAEVTGVCSASKAEFVRSLGATRVLDYTAGPISAEQPFDVIIDIAGLTSVRQLRALLTKTGTIVMVGGEGDNRWTSGFGRTLRAAMLSPFIKQNITMFLSSERSEDLVRLAALVERGAATPRLDRVLPLAEAPTAMELLEQGHIRGKIALTTDSSLN